MFTISWSKLRAGVSGVTGGTIVEHVVDEHVIDLGEGLRLWELAKNRVEP
jgi:hypothetical protein